MITADLAETPYRFAYRHSRTEIALAYGDTIVELWRDARAPNVAADSYRILFEGVAYRFVQQLRPEAAP